LAAAPEDGEGRVWIYYKSGNNWNAWPGMNAPINGGRFGDTHTADISGDLMIIGAPDDVSGTAYLYSNLNANWDIVFKLQFKPYILDSTTSEMIDDTHPLKFGSGPAIISEGFYIVGTNNTSVLPDNLYNFRRRGPEWTPLATGDLMVPEQLDTAKCGTSVTIDGHTAVVGARDYDNRGAAFVFTNTPGTDTWILTDTVQANGVQLYDEFGASVSLSGDTLMVGAPNTAGGDGAVYVFQRLGDIWSQQAVWSGLSGYRFGESVAVDGNTAIVGAPGGD
jgi:hypothetical protein